MPNNEIPEMVPTDGTGWIVQTDDGVEYQRGDDHGPEEFCAEPIRRATAMEDFLYDQWDQAVNPTQLPPPLTDEQKELYKKAGCFPDFQ